ncbi:MAG: transcription elongation factor GreA [Bacilli bacterium]
MSNTKEVYFTVEGLKEVQNELEYLKKVKRPEIILAIKDARSLGDLSENAEYDAARSEQGEVENKIQELEAILEKATIIKHVKTDKVSIGTNVKLEYVADNDIEEYSIVGIKEADPFNNKISNESPIAKAILGLKIGATVSVDSPNGKYDVKVIAIN